MKRVARRLSAGTGISAFLAVLLGGCATTPLIGQSTGRSTTTAPVTSSPSSSTPEGILRIVLTLIQTSSAAQDISLDSFTQAIGSPPARFRADRRGYSGNLTEHWDFLVVLDKAGTTDARLDVEFIDATADRRAPAPEICAMSLEQAADELEAAGFRRETVYGEHGRYMYDRFRRSGLSVEVDSMGAPAVPPQRSMHACILAVRVR
ncbi:hypothetical protein [Stenotrophomonas sp.]|uniref:hypothetical protein n=1 Tax=Stenotrophomonas sp. TaxID=69392 RepID=UPI002FC8B50B